MRLCAVEDVPEGGCLRVEAGPAGVVVVRVGERVFALKDRCTHAGARLSEGWIDAADCTLECPEHGGRFSLATGEALAFPANRPVATFDVEVRDGEVFARLP